MENSCKVEIKPKGFKNWITSWYLWKRVLPVALGALVGYLYYYYIGCSSGSCGITASPWGSMGLGAFFGYFITNSPCKTC